MSRKDNQHRKDELSSTLAEEKVRYAEVKELHDMEAELAQLRAERKEFEGSSLPSRLFALLSPLGKAFAPIAKSAGKSFADWWTQPAKKKKSSSRGIEGTMHHIAGSAVRKSGRRKQV